MPFARPPKLDLIGDVYIPAPVADGTVPTYNATTRRWEAGMGASDSSVNDLNDVTIDGTPADNEVLAYDSGTGDWINQTAAEAGLSTTGHTHALDDLSDVTITAAASGDILRYNGSAWVDFADSAYAAAAHTHAIDDLSDVTISSVASGEILVYNGSAWINQTYTEAGLAGTAYLSMITNETSSGATTEFDVFDQDNYTGGDISNLQLLTAVGVTWTPTNGRFTVTNAGLYLVSIGYQLLIATTGGTVTMNIYKDDVLYQSKALFVTTQTGQTRHMFTFVVSMTAGQYLNFKIDSDSANNAQAEDGTSLTIVKVG